MKSKILLSAFLLFANIGFTQSFASLDINNLKVGFNAAGDQLSQLPNFTNQIVTPQNNINFSVANLWIGGLDPNGQLHIAAQTYRQTGTDFWAGPMDTTTTFCSTAQNIFYDKVWKINKTTIDSFRLGQFSIIPTSITTWPGNGNASAGEGHNLAPYVDVNMDGSYNYQDGDYPKIRGDQALFFVYNDSLSGQIHGETQGKRLGLEIRCLAYAVACSDSALANTIFMHYEIINRSYTTYDSTIVGLWTDIDMNANEGLGSDSLQNDFYYYDTTFAFGAVFLNRSMASTMTYNNDFSGMGNPQGGADNYDYMKSIWQDGTPLTFGGTGHGGLSPTNYFCTGNPFSGTGWRSGNVLIADNRMMGSTASFTFSPDQHYEIDMAYVAFSDATQTPFLCVPNLKQRMQAIKTYYNMDQTPCGDNITVVPQQTQSPGSYSAFPNPASSQITIHTTSEKPIAYSIINLTGQIIVNGTTAGLETLIDIRGLSAGMYFIRIGETEMAQNLPLIKTQ